MVTYSFNLDVTPGGVPVIVNLTQGSDNFQLVFDLFTRTGALELGEGVSATICGYKTDGTGYSVPAEISGSVVTVAGDKQITAVQGKQRFNLLIGADSKVLYTATFYICVSEKALPDDVEESSSYYPMLSKAIESATEAAASAAEATAAKAHVVEAVREVLLAAYPVGSVYLSVDDTNPADKFGGEWEQIQDTFLLAAGSKYTAGSTGGEDKHKLTVAELASHAHVSRIEWNNSSMSGENSNILNVGGNAVQANRFSTLSGNITIDNVPATNDSNTISSTGGGKAHNNMPPYLAVYVWKRTA